MPVPAPTYTRLSAHPVIKPTHNAQGLFGFHAADSVSGDARKYVIEHARQPTGSSNKPFYAFEDDVQLAAFLSRTREAQESLSLHSGLIAADNAAVGKQSHAEACHSPARGSEFLPSSNMGLQRYGGHRSLSELAWSYCGADDDAYPVSFASKSSLGGFGQADAHRMYYGKDNFTSVCEDQYMAIERGEQLSDAVMLQDSTTPFAEYVDRIVANDATHASGDYIVDSQNVLPQVDTPRHQEQAVTAEPLTDPTYIKAYRTMAEPLSNWMADYVWKVCTAGLSLPQRFIGSGITRFYSEDPPSSLAMSVHSLLCSTLLQPSGIVLALWYIARLPVFLDEQGVGMNLSASERDFRKELFGEGQYYSSSAERSIFESRTPFRIVLLGCMLANKWLDDHTFSNKTWQAISEVPIQDINRLELSALAVLSHDLSIKAKAWEQWLAHLHHYQLSLCPYPAPIRRPSATDANILIRRVIEDLVRLQSLPGSKSSTRVAPQPVFSPLLVCDSEKKVEVKQTDNFDPFEIDLDEDGPLREEYVPKRRTSQSGSRGTTHGRSVSSESRDLLQASPPLPPPSEWSPQADPPLERDHGRRDKYFTVPSATGNGSHTRSFSAEYTQYPAWGIQSSSTSSTTLFQPHTVESGVARPPRVFPSLTLGFPLSTACPPISHTRSTLATAAPPSSQTTAHLRSYSHSHTNIDGYCIPSASCAQYVGHPSAFSHARGDPAHFRPLWLRT
ncbi:hypothetical protein DFH11DRAFT_1686528 [Phellopilus nigrolimitatus]|nr:hypothetical protein DFH11DRAFT_1686528 [Phellopilus nigrolimitatus]